MLALARPRAIDESAVQNDRVIAEIERALDERAMSHLPTPILRAEIEKVALDPTRPTDAEYVAAAARSGAGAVLVVDDLHYPGAAFVLATYRALRARARLLAVPDGQCLWEAEIVEREVDGPGLEIEQLLGTILQTFGEYDQAAAARVYAKFAATLVNGVRAAFPSFLDRTPDEDLLVSGVRFVDGWTEAALRGNSFVTLEAHGTPGQTAQALLPGIRTRFPMTESEPGVYRATIPILPGMGTVEGPVIVRLHDRMWRTVGIESRERIRIEASPLGSEDATLVSAASADGFSRWTRGAPRNAAFRRAGADSPEAPESASSSAPTPTAPTDRAP